MQYFCSMKTLLLSTVFIGSLICFSCKGKEHSEKKSAVDSSKFFQVVDFIQSDIAEVNKTPYFIYKKEVNNSKKDSTAINTETFKQLASGFLKPNINEEKLKPEYRENIFADQTTKSITFNYTTLNKSLEVQNVDVLMDENGQKVKRIFIRKFFDYADSSAIEQLTWKPGESFQINRSVLKPDNTETTRQMSVVWNPKK